MTVGEIFFKRHAKANRFTTSRLRSDRKMTDRLVKIIFPPCNQPTINQSAALTVYT